MQVVASQTAAGQIVWRPSRLVPGARSALHWWKNSHGTELPARGFVWIVHGLGEHAGRYHEFATWLGRFGFDVVCPDLPGHGLTRTEGGIENLASFPEMVSDLQDSFRFWVTEGPLAQRGLAHGAWYLFGHSMGAMAALAWILAGKRAGEEEFEFARRAFASAPPLALRMKVPAWKQAVGNRLAHLLPNLKIANGIRPEDLSFDAANVAAYRSDPLVHGHATPKYFTSMVATGEEILRRPGDIEIPLCLAVGADDPVVDGATVKSYFGTLGTHKRFLEFPESKHEIFNECARERCYEAAAAWFL